MVDKLRGTTLRWLTMGTVIAARPTAWDSGSGVKKAHAEKK
jgi:hypothetical protein